MRRRQHGGDRRREPRLLVRDVLVVGLIWGASVVLQRMAVAEIEPLPLIAPRLGVLFLGETVNPPLVGGAVLVLGGVFLFSRA